MASICSGVGAATAIAKQRRLGFLFTCNRGRCTPQYWSSRNSYEVGELCYVIGQIFMHEPTVLQLKAPVKVFGDLMQLFDEYGFPSTAGDIT
nr:serine/threonine-protein phosphatase BSL1-like isoform X2 [Ipomoea batatas]